MRSSNRHEKGVVLVIGLLILLVLTLIGLASMSTSTLEGLMAQNVQYQTQELVKAENALKVGEQRADILNESVSLFVPFVEEDDYMVAGAKLGEYRVVYLGQTECDVGNSVAVGASELCRFYQVTADSSGGVRGAFRRVESVYVRRHNP